MRPKLPSCLHLLTLMILTFSVVSMTGCGSSKKTDTVVGNEKRSILNPDDRPDEVAADAPITVWRKDPKSGLMTKVNGIAHKGFYIVKDPGPKPPVIDPAPKPDPVSLRLPSATK